MSDDFRKTVIKEVYGEKIRKFNYVQVMFNAEEYETLIRQSHDTGIKKSKLVAIKSQSCQNCQHDNVSLVIQKNPIKNSLHEKQPDENA